MGNAGYLEIIEAAYRAEASDEVWLAGLFDAAAPLIDMGAGVVALQYEATVHGGIELKGMAASPALRAIEPASRDYLDRSNGPIIERMFLRTDAMFLRRDAAGSPTEHPEDFEYWKSRGVDEAFSVVGFDPSGHGVMLTAMAPLKARMPARKRELLKCVAAHMASGIRLRKDRASASPGDLSEGGGEAILELDGSIAKVAPELDDENLKNALVSAGRGIAQARSGDLTEEEAVDVWTALWSGRWSLVERTEKDGSCYLLARRNAPNLAEPKALSLRERQVLAYAQMGHTQKFIGFELGLAISTVSAHISSGMRKLGIKNRADLARFAFVPDDERVG